MIVTLTTDVSNASEATRNLDPTTRNLQLFLLVGQSNMSGRGILENATVEASSNVWTFGNDNVWRPAEHPIDDSLNQLDSVSNDELKPGVGLGITFANAVAKAGQTGVGLVPCAMGGSSMVEWLPNPAAVRDPNTLFGNCLSRTRLAMQQGRVSGILVHQGETDARSLVTAEYWDLLFANVIQAFRNAFENPSLPIVFAQIGDLSDERRERRPFWERVQRSQERSSLRCSSIVQTMDLSLMDDKLHLTSTAEEELGLRFAKAYLLLTAECQYKSTK